MLGNSLRRRMVGGLIVVLAVASAPSAYGQDTVLADLYGQGVHAYYRGDFAEAYQHLDSVVEQGTDDPRVYYFRGLFNIRLGNEDMAQADFQKGAELEMDRRQVYPVGKALARVQGGDRLMLEEARDEVRVQTYLRKQAEEKARRQSLIKAEDRVLVQPGDSPKSEIPVEVPEADDTDPFGGSDPASAPMPPTPVPSATPDATETPAPSDMAPVAPAPTNPSSDPFGDSPSDDSPMPAVDPFGSSEPAMEEESGSDPFAPAGGNTPPAESDPFAPGGAAAPPAESDPFAPGDSPAPMPNTPSADPFGDSMPADVPMGDPFGAGPADDAVAPIPGASSGKNPVSAAFDALGNALIPSVEMPELPGMPAGGPPSDAAMPPAAGGSSDPFGPMPSGAPPADNDPFGPPPAGQPSSDPFGPPPAGNAPMNPSVDPLGPTPSGSTPAGNDPFAPPAGEPSADPFGPPPAGADPFGS